MFINLRSVTLLSGIYPKETIRDSQEDGGTGMFIPVSIIMVKTGNNLISNFRKTVKLFIISICLDCHPDLKYHVGKVITDIRKCS